MTREETPQVHRKVLKRTVRKILKGIALQPIHQTRNGGNQGRRGTHLAHLPRETIIGRAERKRKRRRRRKGRIPLIQKRDEDIERRNEVEPEVDGEGVVHNKHRKMHLEPNICLRQFKKSM